MTDKQGKYRTPEDNPKMKEIFDILLMAGYFRIRIPSINTFDKILGGLIWCISCSNYEIDIEYQDDMQLGQKIKLAEKVCAVLKKMQCPIDIQPHQIQGLDFDRLYPIIQWLIKFVYETREMRQDFNKSMSQFIGKKVFRTIDEKENFEKQQIQDVYRSNIQYQDRRITRNSKINQFNRKDPLRVYSTLIEFGDATAYKTYNKLCALLSGKIQVSPNKSQKKEANKSHQSQPKNKDQGDTNQKKDELSSMMNVIEDNVEIDVQSLLFHHGKQLQQEDNSKSGSVKNDDLQLDQTVVNNFTNIEKAQGKKVGETLIQLVQQTQNQIQDSLKAQQTEGSELEFAKIISNEKERHQAEIQALKKTIQAQQKKVEELSDELYKIKEQEKKVGTDLEEEKVIFTKLKDSSEIIQDQISKHTAKIKDKSKIEEAENLIIQKQELEQKKNDLKKEIKQQMADLQQEAEKVQSEIPNIDQDYYNELIKEVNERKKIFDEKYKDFAQLNCDIAVIQRKIENFPSATEIGQYHQRFTELFENVLDGNERQKQYNIKYNALESQKKFLQQFIDIMTTFKDNYQINSKSRSGRENFIEQLKGTISQLEIQKTSTAELVNKQKKVKDQCQENFTSQQQIEREYYKLIKELRMELEKNEYLTQQLQNLQGGQV